MTRLTIAHVVNPVAVGPESDLAVAQPITFETMRRARATAPGVEVTLLSAQYAEDRAAVPPDFEVTEDLVRSALDLDPPVTTRKLPFVADICERLHAASAAEYLVYTNVDIALQPEFYARVADLIREGLDAFALTRRNISDRFTTVDDLPAMYVAPGSPQRGPDCFVFHRDLYPGFRLDGILTGEPGVGRVLLANLVRFGTNPAFLADTGLTFHIGNDGAWRSRPDGAGRLNLERSLAIVSALLEELADGERRGLVRTQLEALERMLARV